MNTKEDIKKCAVTLFNERGYDNVTMRLIANTLGISVGNVTYHFPKKIDLLMNIMNEPIVQMPEEKDISLKSLDLLLRAYVKSLLDYSFFFTSIRLLEEAPEFRLNNKMNEDNLKNKFKEYIIQLKDKGYFKKDITDIQLNALIDLIMYAHLAWINDSCKLRKEEKLSKEIFIETQWNVISVYLSDKGLIEYKKLYK